MIKILFGILLVLGVLLVPWGIVHGALELGQMAFADVGWTWEPRWYQSAIGMVLAGFIRRRV